MQSSRLFWPSDRKLFRQRSRLRNVAPTLAIVAAVLLAFALGSGWN